MTCSQRQRWDSTGWMKNIEAIRDNEELIILVLIWLLDVLSYRLHVQANSRLKGTVTAENLTPEWRSSASFFVVASFKKTWLNDFSHTVTGSNVFLIMANTINTGEFPRSHPTVLMYQMVMCLFPHSSCVGYLNISCSYITPVDAVLLLIITLCPVLFFFVEAACWTDQDDTCAKWIVCACVCVCGNLTSVLPFVKPIGLQTTH